MFSTSFFLKTSKIGFKLRKNRVFRAVACFLKNQNFTILYILSKKCTLFGNFQNSQKTQFTVNPRICRKCRHFTTATPHYLTHNLIVLFLPPSPADENLSKSGQWTKGTMGPRGAIGVSVGLN